MNKKLNFLGSIILSLFLSCCSTESSGLSSFVPSYQESSSSETVSSSSESVSQIESSSEVSSSFTESETSSEIVSSSLEQSSESLSSSEESSSEIISSSTIQKVTITVVGGEGSGEYEVGETVTITASVPDYMSFDYWKYNDQNVSTDNPYSFIAVEDATYEAVFKANKGTLTVINGTGSGEYDLNTDVTVEATPSSKEVFVCWKIDDEIVSTTSTYTFRFIKDTTITAVLESSNKMAKYTKTVYKKNDTFKILNLTDIQVTNGDDLTLTKHIIDTLVEEQQPDLITFLGDMLNDSPTYNSDLSSKNVFDYIDAKDIPWAPIFGNHDNTEYNATYETKKAVGVPYLMGLFANYENCLFVEGPSDVLGKSNYVVNIVEESNNKLVEQLIFLDSFTNGLDSTNVGFYEDAVSYGTELNDGTKVPAVVFSHIPVQEYLDEYNRTQSIECQDAFGVIVGAPLATNGDTLFASMKANGNTKTMICGHDHENQYYTIKDGIKLAYAMKSSDGDNDSADYIHKHPLGGLLLTVDGVNEDQLDYVRVKDIGFTVTKDKSYDFHPEGLPYWKYSGAKLVFDVEIPETGKVQFNLQGTNMTRGSVEYKKRVGSWNRLTGNVDLTAGVNPTVDYGKLTLIEGNKYRYEVDVSTINLNTGGGEVAYGDETVRLVYFHNATGDFTIKNVHYEYENIIETNQIDLSSAVIGNIQDQVYADGLPVKPTATVTLNDETLKLVDDILLTYEDNTEVGTATLKVVPSGKGAHKYKGSISKTFDILSNPLRGEAFEKGYSKDLETLTISTDSLEFDVHFTSTGDNVMKFMIGDGWSSLFGYYGLKNDGTLEENYRGISVKATNDDYYHVTCILSQLNKQNGSTPMPTNSVNLFYIHGSWGNNPTGYIDFNVEKTYEPIRGEAFSSEGKTINFSKLTYADTIIVDFKFTSAASTHVNFMVGNSGNGWNNYFGYYRLDANGSLGDNYGGISVSTTQDGYFRLTIVLNNLTKASGAGGPSQADGFNLFYIRNGWTDATGYVDFNPQETPITPTTKTTEFTMDDDNFVIANFTDIHVDKESLLSDSGTVGKTIKYGIQKSNPDILVFSGDIAGASSDLDYICTYLDSFKIPYFFILGNHDHEGSLGYNTFETKVAASKYGYIEKGPENLGSQGNYTVKIKNSDGDLVHGLVLMDSGNKYTVTDDSKVEYVTEKISGVKYGSYGGKTTYCDSGWNGIRGNQIDWYEDTVQALNCETTLFCHIPCLEYVKAYEQYMIAVNSGDQSKIDACAPIGNCTMGEQCCGSIENLGLFDTILENGSTKNVICGHDHLNDFSLLYQGVRLTYALKTGEGAYWLNTGARCGYTELTINSSGQTSLDQVYFNPLA